MRTFTCLTRTAAAVTVGAAALISAVLISAPAPAMAADGSRQLRTTQSAPMASVQDRLFGVGGVSPSDIWAVGSSHAGGADRTLIEHWNGRSWVAVASPSPGGSGGSYLEAVAAASRSSAWAVGGYGELTLIEHWNGRSWKQVRSPSPGGRHGSYLNALAIVSSSNAWAVGAYDDGLAWQTLIEHWNGRSWRRVASPNPSGSGMDNYINGVAATSASNAWAVGYYNVNGSMVTRTLVEHWNGHSWKQMASPSPNGGAFNGLNAVAGVSPSSAWAVGSYSNGVADNLLLERWNGRSWKRAAVQNPTSTNDFSDFAGVAAVSGSSAWVDGNYFRTGPSKTLIEHWNGKAWKQQTSPSPGGTAGSYLHGFDALSSVDAWAVGNYLSGPSSLTLIEHWNGKAWRRIPSPNR